MGELLPTCQTSCSLVALFRTEPRISLIRAGARLIRGLVRRTSSSGALAAVESPRGDPDGCINDAAGRGEYDNRWPAAAPTAYNFPDQDRAAAVQRNEDGWESMDAVRAVAGEDIERVVPSPENARFLVQFDAAAVHYEVVDVCPKEPMT